jgi:FkbM family methyltransferase
LFIDLQNKLPGLRVKTVFDVGANVGQSARRYVRHFPSARIFCFEPVKSTFAILRDNTAGLGNIQIHNIAMGAAKEKVSIRLQESSLVNSLLNRVDTEMITNAAVEDIEVDMLDDFCARNNITEIDFLKIDTEGFDLNVLLGAQGMLDGRRISFVQVEAGVSLKNELHVSLEVLKEHLESKGFFLFGIYDQTPEWSGEPLMSFCNAVFISSHIIKTYWEA